MKVFDRFYCCKVKVLCIQKCINLTIDQKLAHRFCQTADTKSHADSTLFHNFCKRDRRSDGGTADTCLIGKSVFEIWGIYNKLCTVICHHKLSHICGRFCRTSCDLVRVTDRIYFYDIVHICHGNVCREVRERNHAVCDGNYVICMESI